MSKAQPYIVSPTSCLLCAFFVVLSKGRRVFHIFSRLNSFVIRGNIVTQDIISTLYLNVAAGFDLHRLSINPAGIWPSQTVLRDSL